MLNKSKQETEKEAESTSNTQNTIETGSGKHNEFVEFLYKVKPDYNKQLRRKNVYSYL